MCTHHAGERTLVGQRKRPIPERMCLGNQFLGMRGPPQEGEIADDLQRGVRKWASARAVGSVVGIDFGIGIGIVAKLDFRMRIAIA